MTSGWDTGIPGRQTHCYDACICDEAGSQERTMSGQHGANKDKSTARAQDTGREEIDLERVARLLSAMEKDLAQIPAGSEHLQALRDEVETLRMVLASPRPRQGWIREGLHSIHSVMQNALGSVVGEAIKDWPYVAEIGRILGLS
jgi:hypothetical protein